MLTFNFLCAVWLCGTRFQYLLKDVCNLIILTCFIWGWTSLAYAKNDDAMIEVSFMHRVDSFNYISFFVLCIFYILDLLCELFLEHAPRATHVAPAGN